MHCARLPGAQECGGVILFLFFSGMRPKKDRTVLPRCSQEYEKDRIEFFGQDATVAVQLTFPPFHFFIKERLINVISFLHFCTCARAKEV
jgi:hypothetical protein